MKKYGNFEGYYAYRSAGYDDAANDPRLSMLPEKFFEGKFVLDIGCNIGLPTIAIAKLHKPKLIIGVDIDESLVRRARKGISMQYSLMEPEGMHAQKPEPKAPLNYNYFPISCPLTLGTVPWFHPPHETGVQLSTATQFPNNISFWPMDYLHPGASSSGSKVPFEGNFDVILAWSITKWIHLNWGDAGIKEFFNKIFVDLKPGGAFVLEPQDFPSYSKRRRMNETTATMYKTIEFKPDQFTDYLVNTVGFEKPIEMGTVPNQSQGFKRPLLLFTKPVLQLSGSV